MPEPWEGVLPVAVRFKLNLFEHSRGREGGKIGSGTLYRARSGWGGPEALYKGTPSGQTDTPLKT